MKIRNFKYIFPILVLLMATNAFSKKKFSSSNQPTVAVDEDRLKSNVSIICDRFFPRDESHPEILAKAAAFIKGEFEKAGGNPIFQDFVVNGSNYSNVISYFGPDTDERIVVGAHYDAFGELPGANDNASGVAGIVELAYLLGAYPPSLKVELVAYTLEEPPYFRSSSMGSAVHAKSLKEKGVKVRGMIALETIGYFSNEPKSQAYPSPILKLFYPSKGNFIAIVGRWKDKRLNKKVRRAFKKSSELPVKSLSAPSFLPGVDFSDHLNYWNEGYRAVMVTDTAFYRNSSYHQPSDTPDTLDYEKMGLVIKGVFRAINDLCEWKK